MLGLGTWGRRLGDRWHRGIVAFAALLMAVVGLVVGQAPQAGAVGLPNFSLQPVSTPNSIHPRGSFHYDLKPGESIDDAVVLTNPTTSLEQFQIWPTDALNTAVGGAFALRPYGYKMTGVGTWINTHLGGGVYGLNGGAAVTIHFTVTVPANATPGDHAGGIEALNVTPEAQPTKGPAHFVVQQGVATAVFIRVAGPAHPSAAISDISVKTSVPALGFGNRTATVKYQLENTGNTILAGNVQATVTDLFGRTVKTFPPVSVQAFVPGQRFTYTEPLWKATPIFGPGTVHVKFVSSGMAAATGSGTFWIFPWLLVLIVLVVLALIAWRLWLWRRHRRARATAEGRDDTPDGTTDGATPAADEVALDEPAAVPTAPVGSGT